MAAKRGLELARCPVDVLVYITDLLLASDIYILGYLCGSSLLRSKLVQRGVRSLHFDTLSTEKVPLKFFGNFTGLVRVSIHCISPDISLNLVDLPSGLQDLHIQLANLEVLNWKPSVKDLVLAPVEERLVFLPKGYCSFDFQRHFPTLRHLHLEQVNGSIPYSHDVEQVLACQLPPTLETLFMHNMNTINARYWKYLPRGLTVLNLGGSVNSTFFKLLKAHAPHVTIDHLIVDSVDPIFASAPARVVSLHSKASSWSDIRKFALLFPMTGQAPPAPRTSSLQPFPSTHQHLHPNRPYLVSIITSNNLETIETVVADEWPESLHTFYDGHAHKHYPSILANLNATVSNMESISVPSGVHTLTLRVRKERPLTDFIPLPSCLTSLTFIGSPSLKLEELKVLPATLTKLNFGVQTLREQVLTAQLVDNLPSNLVEFQFSGTCDDQLLTRLPASLTDFKPRTILLSGVVPFDESIKLKIRPYGTLFRKKAVGWCFKFRRNSSTHYVLKNVPVPPSLTSLSLQTLKITPTAFAYPLHLPSLTRLKVCDMIEFGWPEDGTSCLPSVTYLAMPTASDPFINYPSSVTHLKLTSSRFDTAVAAVMQKRFPKLRILELPFCIPNNLYSLNALESLSSNWPWLSYDNEELAKAKGEETRVYPYENETLPPSLTHLEVCSERMVSLDVERLLRVCPKLRSLKALTAMLREDDLEMLPSTFQSLSCDSISITSVKPYLSVHPPMETTFDFERSMKSRLKSRYPFISDETRVGLSRAQFTPISLEMEDLPQLFGSPSTSMITTIKIGAGARLPSRFGKCLPSTLTSLDVLHVFGIDKATPYYLPSSLKDLKIDSSDFPSTAYRQLPRGITFLELNCPKLHSRYCVEMPPALLSLTLTKSEYLQIGALEELPDSVTHVKIDKSHNDVWHSLPENLRFLDTPDAMETLGVILDDQDTDSSPED